MNRKAAIFSLLAVMLVTLLGTAGIALPYPVLAPYFLDGNPNGLTGFYGLNPKLLMGLALAVYPLGLLVGSTFIGALSDVYGRRKILLVTLGGSVAGYLLTTYAVLIESYPLFILARLATGIFEGNIAVARAMAADLHPHIERTRALSMVQATVSVGWLVGPLAGGYLMVFGPQAAFLAAAVAVFLCWLVILLAIPTDPKLKSDRPRSSWSAGFRSHSSLRLWSFPEIRPIFMFYLAFTLGQNGFYEFYPIWFVESLDADSKTIAWATVVLTATMTLSSIFFTSWLVKRKGKYRTLLMTTAAFGILLAMQPLAGPSSIYLVFVAIGLMIGITGGVVPSYLSEHFGHHGQGRILGLQTTTFCLANVVVAIVGSLIAVINTSLALWTSALLIGIATIRLISLPASGKDYRKRSKSGPHPRQLAPDTQ